MELFAKFEAYISKHKLCTKDDRILLAVSGGKDSMLMLHLFITAGYKIAIAHCNFHLRGKESIADEQFVRKFAEKHQIPIFVKSFTAAQFAKENKISIQMACRDLRYQWFEQLREAERFESIAVAHHATDSVESTLINLVRGTGVEGLTGIQPKRDAIIRPLLFMTAEQVARAVSEMRIIYREDSSNLSTGYLRNKLRLQVLPHLKEINPDIEQTFLQNSSIFGEIRDFIHHYIRTWRKQHVVEVPNGWQIQIDALRKLEPPRLLIYELLKPYHFSAAVCHDIVQCISHREMATGKMFYSSTHRLLIDRELIFIAPLEHAVIATSSNPIPLGREDRHAFWNNCTIGLDWVVEESWKLEKPLTPQKIYLDADKLTFPLEIRAWQQGDTFKPLGMGRRTKKVSDFLVSLKIPLWDKDRIPLIIDGTGEIIWICPYRMSETFKISDKTEKVLSLSYFCEDGA